MFNDKILLITGGTGTFGNAVLRRFLNTDIKEIRVSSRDEKKQEDLRIALANPKVKFFIGDVRDLQRLNRAFEGVNYVIHAAALKQITACEYNPIEAIKTNILGGSNVIDAALNTGVEKVIALSTDKAVNPINLYGATKLCAEKLFIQSNSYAGGKNTRFSCVRYGNVVGSRGSVVPIFLKQKETGKITITDERMTRFWITLEQGVKFVLDCLSLMQGGEIFIPKIPSMKVVDLAKAIAPDSKIEIIGIRPGEKLHEVLISEDEARTTVELDEMFVVQPSEALWFGREWESQGNKLTEGFKYTSNNNGKWLSLTQISDIIHTFETRQEDFRRID